MTTFTFTDDEKENEPLLKRLLTFLYSHWDDKVWIRHNKTNSYCMRFTGEAKNLTVSITRIHRVDLLFQKTVAQFETGEKLPLLHVNALWIETGSTITFNEHEIHVTRDGKELKIEVQKKIN